MFDSHDVSSGNEHSEHTARPRSEHDDKAAIAAHRSQVLFHKADRPSLSRFPVWRLTFELRSFRNGDRDRGLDQVMLATDLKRAGDRPVLVGGEPRRAYILWGLKRNTSKRGPFLAPSHQEKQSRDRKQPNLYSRIAHFDQTTPLVESSKVCRTAWRSAASPPSSCRVDSTPMSLRRD